MRRSLQPARGAFVYSELTPREREVLGLLAQGLLQKQIAAELGIAPHTVKNHCSEIYKRLRVRNKGECLLRAYRLKILELEYEPTKLERLIDQLAELPLAIPRQKAALQEAIDILSYLSKLNRP